MKKDITKIGAKPLGFKGRIAGLLMNVMHSRQYKKLIRQVMEEFGGEKGLVILDIGCGGGKAVKLFCDTAQSSGVYGIDHSLDMVRLARKVNKSEIVSGKADIKEGNVASLPYSDSSFDIAAAFDTINFWPDIDKSMHEVYRVLKDDGILFIVNGYPKQGTKWWKFAVFKNEEEYRSMLQSHGFERIRSTIERNTIIIKAYKKLPTESKGL